MERLRVEHELADLTAFVGRCYSDLAAELIRFMGFSFSDALSLRCKPGRKLAPALVLALLAGLSSLSERVGECPFQLPIACTRAADVAIKPAQSDAQKGQLFNCSV